MSKNRTPTAQHFGGRLAALRRNSGYTQVELADEIGISQRMVAYYEGPDAHPPANLLPAIATALNVTLDELLGVTSIKKQPRSGPVGWRDGCRKWNAWSPPRSAI